MSPIDIRVTVWVSIALALGLTALSLNVSRLRLRYRMTWGDGGHRDLIVAIRTHGNTLEQSILFVLLLCLAQIAGLSSPIAAGLGTAFVVARLLYGAAAFYRRLLVRQLAHVASVLCQLLTLAALARLVWPS